MSTPDPLRSHLINLLTWHDAHIDFDRAVEGVPTVARGRLPQGAPHSLWQLVEHLRRAQNDILEFCVNPEYREKKWPDDYWPTAAPRSDAAWDEAVAGYRSDRKTLQSLVLDPATDLFARIPHGTGQTYLREVLLVADHDAYHVGQIVLVRRLLGVWSD